jgi:8-oxo-dGTP pyrophosphatase MutT (NUDIX family)
MRDARLVETEVLLTKPKRFVREALVMPDGYELDWYYVDTPPSVMVVPVTADDGLVLVRQYRHNLKAYALEFPAGTVGEGEEPAQARCASWRRKPASLSRQAGSCARSARTTRCLRRRTSTRTSSSRSPPCPSARLAAALEAIGDSISGTETVTALMLARRARGVS